MTNVTLTTKQAQQIEEALEDIVRVFKFETGAPVEALAALREQKAELGKPLSKEPVAYINKHDLDFVKEYKTGVNCVLSQKGGSSKVGLYDFYTTACQIADAWEDGYKAASKKQNITTAPQPVKQEPVAFRFPRDTESWTGGWTIDHKVIRSVDAEIEDNEFKPCLEGVEQVLLALEKVYAASQTMKQEPEQYPTYGFCPICGSRGISRERRINGNDTCANGHSYASNLALHVAPEKQAEQEPKELVPVLAGFDRSKYTKEQWDWCLEYLSITDYEPMMCDFEYGTHTFYEAVQASVQWYEDHTSDMHLKISKTVGKFDPEKEVDYD